MIAGCYGEMDCLLEREWASPVLDKVERLAQINQSLYS